MPCISGLALDGSDSLVGLPSSRCCVGPYVAEWRGESVREKLWVGWSSGYGKGRNSIRLRGGCAQGSEKGGGEGVVGVRMRILQGKKGVAVLTVGAVGEVSV